MGVTLILGLEKGKRIKCANLQRILIQRSLTPERFRAIRTSVGGVLSQPLERQRQERRGVAKFQNRHFAFLPCAVSRVLNFLLR